MKLVAAEPESDALVRWLRTRPVRVTSIAGRIETQRAARRAAAAADDAAVADRASEALAVVETIGLSEAIAERAGVLGPPPLRTLDAIHLATAILIGPVEAFVTYDDRLAAAARGAGLVLAQPGRGAGQ